MNSKPIRILHVLAAMDRAGAETMLMNIYRVIDREKVQFDFAVNTEKRCDYDGEIEALGGRIIHYPKYKGKNHFSYKKWWDKFFQQHSEYKIIHGHAGAAAAIYLKEAKKHGCYTIAHSHSVYDIKSLKTLLHRLYTFKTRYIADYFFGCSYIALSDRYGKRTAEDKSRSSVLNNGIDVKKYIYNPVVKHEVMKELNLPENAFVIGTVGRFIDAKNPFFIVDILHELKKECNDFIFLWTGGGG